MSRSHFILYSVAAVLLVILIFSCGKELTDARPPSEISGLKVVEENEKVILSWNDPPNFDFYRVQIIWSDKILEVEKDVETAEITDLKNGETYTIVVKTMDFNNNLSAGTSVQATPNPPPNIQWEEEGFTEIGYNYMNLPNGEFTTSRVFTNSGSFGYITFTARVKNLAENTVVDEVQKSFLVLPDQPCRFICNSSGDITIFNCTVCETPVVNFIVEFSSNQTAEVFYARPALCSDVPVCANGNSKREGIWNSIRISFMDLEYL